MHGETLPAGGIEVRGGLVLRPRLLDLLDGGSGRITLLQASSGFGKTTLVRQWADRGAFPVIWVALTQRLESDRAFWVTVVAAARRQGHLSAESAESAAQHLGGADDPVEVLVGLWREVPIIVIDAYEHLQNATGAVDDQIRRFANSGDARFVVTTRSRTSLADQSATRIVTEGELEFTAEETAALLAATRHGAIDATASEIHQDTRGYPLAVRAASLALGSRQHLSVGASAGWAEIVVQDLSMQMEGSRTAEFVRDTALAPYFDVDLAGQLSGVDNAKSVIGDLEWNGFGQWVPYLAGRPVFQYVDSLRDAIRRDLAGADPERYRRGTGIAAEWLQTHLEHELSFQMAVDAHHYELADRTVRSLLLSSSQSYSTDHLEQHFSRIPQEAFARYPILSFGRGWALSSNPATLTAAVGYLMRAADQTQEDWRDQDLTGTFYQQLIKTMALRIAGRYVESGAAGRETVNFFDTHDVPEDDTLVELPVAALRQIGYSLLQLGEFEEASRAFRRSIDMSDVAWARNYSLVCAAACAALEGRTRVSAAIAGRVDASAWGPGETRSIASALGRVAAATRALDGFDFAGTLAAYEGVESLVRTMEFWPFIKWTTLQAHLGQSEGGAEATRIAEALVNVPPPPGTGENFGTAMLQGLLALSWLSLGRPEEAAPLLEQGNLWPGQFAPAVALLHLRAGSPEEVLRQFSDLDALTGHSIRSRASLATFAAAAASRCGDRTLAGQLLKDAARAYDEHGCRAHLLHIPVEDLEALRGLADGEAARYLALGVSL